MKILILSVLAIFIIPVSAEVFKWKDENGKVHYGDKVPEKYASESTSINTNNSTILSFDKKPSKRPSWVHRKQEKPKTVYEIREEERRSSDKLLRDFNRKQTAIQKKRNVDTCSSNPDKCIRNQEKRFKEEQQRMREYRQRPIKYYN